MSNEQISRYLTLVEQRLFIFIHSGVDWRPEYGPELTAIDKEISEQRPLVEQEHRCRREFF